MNSSGSETKTKTKAKILIFVFTIHELDLRFFKTHLDRKIIVIEQQHDNVLIKNNLIHQLKFMTALHSILDNISLKKNIKNYTTNKLFHKTPCQYDNICFFYNDFINID